MIQVAALIASTLLVALAIFQLLLVLGLPLGQFAWGGKHTILPTGLRRASILSIILYVVFALIILEASSLTTLISNPNVSNIGIWLLAAYFTLGISLNAMSRSKPERLVMTPVCIVLAIACLIIALG